ncbi:MAG: glycosyltransferase family 4 protein [Candidatus Moranbacteria bacterium]|nr:glycosyltransferase family 4 protein [Candidatus Moranbacteria bacterium]
MKILFVSHSYPPIWGGVESQNYNLSESLKNIAEVKVIANGKGKKFLPIFLPVTFLKMLFLMRKFDACLLGNGVLAPLGAVAKIFHPKKKFFCVVHGLDITFARKKGFLPSVYKAVNIPSLKKMDRLIMVGNATIEEAVKIGIGRDLCKFIPNGINPEEFCETHAREEISKVLKTDVSNKKIIFRLARFVPHKGTSWFLENVMPQLGEDVIIVAAGARVGKNTAGDKDDFSVCEKIVSEKNLKNRVWLIPFIPEDEKRVLLGAADLMISPNVKIPGSMEGFGINAIEAAVCGRVMVASDLEGLKDAIMDGQNGFLAEPGNAEVWTEKIKKLLSEDEFRKEFGQKAAEYTIEHFSWEKIAKEYLEAMQIA